MGRMVATRQAVFAAITADKLLVSPDPNAYPYNNFDLEWTYLPYQALKDVPENGKVWVIGMAAVNYPNKSRAGLFQKEIPIQVAIQRKVKPQDLTLLDTMINLVEAVERTVMKVNSDDFQITRIEPLRDEEETPYAWVGLREAGLFEAYFTAFFLFTVDPRS